MTCQGPDHGQYLCLQTPGQNPHTTVDPGCNRTLGRGQRKRPRSGSQSICNLRQVRFPLWTSVSSSIKWGYITFSLGKSRVDEKGFYRFQLQIFTVESQNISPRRVLLQTSPLSSMQVLSSWLKQLLKTGRCGHSKPVSLSSQDLDIQEGSLWLIIPEIHSRVESPTGFVLLWPAPALVLQPISNHVSFLSLWELQNDSSRNALGQRTHQNWQDSWAAAGPKVQELGKPRTGQGTGLVQLMREAWALRSDLAVSHSSAPGL